jgi:ATP-dependent RNA helicase DHX37/DHR1
MEEIHKLRSQLSSLIESAIPSAIPALHKWSLFSLPPPSASICTALRQIILAGFPDNIAKLDIEATKKSIASGAKNAGPVYTAMWSGKEDIFSIHGASCLFRERPAPEWITFEEVVGGEERINNDNIGIMNLRGGPIESGVSKPKKLYLKNVTAILSSWITKVGPPTLLKTGKVMEQPEPYFDPVTDKVMGYAAPNYGPKMWELPVTQIPIDGKDSIQWFARYLLEGKVYPGRFVGKKSKKKEIPKDLFGIIQVMILLSLVILISN